MTDQEQMNGHPYEVKLVMLIDDNTVDNFINNRVITFYHFAARTIIHTSPILALEELKRIAEENNSDEIPAFIFLDLDMPLMDGFGFMAEFARLPAAFRKSCKVIVLSNSMNPADVSTAVNDRNVFAYLSKPLIKTNLLELSALIHNNPH